MPAPLSIRPTWSQPGKQADRLAQIGFGGLVGAHDDQGLADMAGEHGRAATPSAPAANRTG